MAQKNEFEWMIPIKTMLGSIDHREVQGCSISRVSPQLRKPKEDAFRPNLVSLGLLHRGSNSHSHLQLMEEPKWRYTLSLLRREGPIQGSTRSADEVRSEYCGEAILMLDELIRASYGGHIQLERYELAKLMLVDGCFVLELLLRLCEYIDKKSVNGSYSDDDPIFENEDKLLSILSDLTLLENQIPFIVLKKLYRKIFATPTALTIQNDHRVADLFLNAFGYPSVQKYSGVAHLLHLIHLSTVDHENNEQVRGRHAFQELKRCATRLRAEGIMIKPANSSKFVMYGRFVDNFDCNISFSNGILTIPPLHIMNTTEVKWRNLIAWEQSRMGVRCRYTSYALFFKSLICCQHDIQWLEKIGVIVNDSGKSKEELVKMFDSMAEGVEHMDFGYKEICESLNNYGGTNPLRKYARIMWHQWRRILDIIAFYWRNWYAVLIRDHIPTVWKLIGVLAAAALLALTIMQTYYAARSNGN